MESKTMTDNDIEPTEFDEAMAEAGRLPGGVTIMQLASFKLGHQAETGADYAKVHLPMLAGCEVCGEQLACYNAYPSKSGYTRCAQDLGDDGFATVEEADAAIFAHNRLGVD